MSIKHNDKYNEKLSATCGFVYYGPRSITAHEADRSKANKNQTLEKQYLKEIMVKHGKDEKNWYVMPKYDGNSICFWEGNWISKKGTFEALSLRKDNQTGGTYMFGKINDMQEVEEEIRVYFNRLCALIWDEYMQALTAEDSSLNEQYWNKWKSDHKEKYGDFNTTTNALPDYNAMLCAKSPVTLMCEMVCEQNTREALELKQTSSKTINAILMSGAYTLEEKQQAFVANLHEFQAEERYKSFYQLQHERRDKTRFFAPQLFTINDQLLDKYNNLMLKALTRDNTTETTETKTCIQSIKNATWAKAEHMHEIRHRLHRESKPRKYAKIERADEFNLFKTLKLH